MNRYTSIVSRLSIIIAASAALVACGGGGDNANETVASSPSTDSEVTTDSAAGAGSSLTGAAGAAQVIIDAGAKPATCPVDIGYISAIMSKSVPLSSVYNGPTIDEGQLYTDGDVDLVSCWIRVEGGGTDAGPGEVIDMRLDIHPGTADVSTYLNEQWGAMTDPNSESVDGATITSGCLDDTKCVAMWQDPDLFVALMIETPSAATADIAVTGLEVAAPLVVDNLANGF